MKRFIKVSQKEAAIWLGAHRNTVKDLLDKGLLRSCEFERKSGRTKKRVLLPACKDCDISDLYKNAKSMHCDYICDEITRGCKRVEEHFNELFNKTWFIYLINEAELAQTGSIPIDKDLFADIFIRNFCAHEDDTLIRLSSPNSLAEFKACVQLLLSDANDRNLAKKTIGMTFSSSILDPSLKNHHLIDVDKYWSFPVRELHSLYRKRLLAMNRWNKWPRPTLEFKTLFVVKLYPDKPEYEAAKKRLISWVLHHLPKNNLGANTKRLAVVSVSMAIEIEKHLGKAESFAFAAEKASTNIRKKISTPKNKEYVGNLIAAARIIATKAILCYRKSYFLAYIEDASLKSYKRLNRAILGRLSPEFKRSVRRGSILEHKARHPHKKPVKKGRGSILEET